MEQSELPDTAALVSALTQVVHGEEIQILQRAPNPFERTFPTEIVTCRRANGSEERLFCKYMDYLSPDYTDHGSRGGVAYEGKIYARILHGVPLSMPAYLGTFQDQTGAAWLVLRHLEDAEELDRTLDRTALRKAAMWIGSFHALTQHLTADRLDFLKVYDAAYYHGWSRRTAAYAGDWHRQSPWLRHFCRRFEPAAELLLAAPGVIHGEYYPRNILVRKEAVYPVDWETTARAAGEIDLAMLTEGWAPDLVQECEQAYVQARWSRGAPADFGHRLAIARIYVHMRWLGNEADWSTLGDAAWRLEELRRTGEALGLIA
jgi:thiamine kinase-like enzyme